MTKYIIFKEFGKIKGSTAENYLARIQDANKILTFNGFTSLQQAKDYMVKYSKLTDEEIKIIEENNNSLDSI